MYRSTQIGYHNFFSHFKEPLFFNDDINYQNGLKWYSATYYKNTANKKCLLDFTPTYLYSSRALNRIFSYSKNENLKFIVMLRNPVDRAYSHFLHTKRDGYEKLDFKTAIDLENERLVSLQKTKNQFLKLKFSYIQQSLYFKYLSKYFDLFDPKMFHIINYDSQVLDKKRISQTVEGLLQFLEIEKINLETYVHKNSASKNRFKFLQFLINSKGLHKKIMKSIVPSKVYRQILVNKLRRVNEVPIKKNKLDLNLKKEIFDNFFKKDVNKLEAMINKKMFWNVN